MSSQLTFWPDLRRALFQWAGVVVAVIISGLLLGVLLRQGVDDTTALEICLVVGFVLALGLWVGITGWMALRAARAAQVPITFEGELAVTYSLQYAGQPTIACPTRVA
jgi:hypothetical protein